MRLRKRKRETTIQFIAPGGYEVPAVELRAGMMITRANYNHSTRKITVTIESRKTPLYGISYPGPIDRY